MTKQDPRTEVLKPTFDTNIPVPRKGRVDFLDAKRAYIVGQEQFGISYGLSCMEVGDSCLLSNWATTTITYLQQKLGYRFQRELQADGTVRVWRIE